MDDLTLSSVLKRSGVGKDRLGVAERGGEREEGREVAGLYLDLLRLGGVVDLNGVQLASQEKTDFVRISHLNHLWNVGAVCVCGWAGG